MKITRSIFYMLLREMNNSHTGVYTFNHQANASDDADFENERTVRHKKKLSIKADKTVPVDEYMDFAIEDEVYMIFFLF